MSISNRGLNTDQPSMRISFPSYLFSLQASSVSKGLSSVNTTATGIYNSSTTPASLPWNTYNYCNAPHVNAKHYFKPTGDKGAKLVYLNVVTRHHKVSLSYFDGISFPRLTCKSESAPLTIFILTRTSWTWRLDGTVAPCYNIAMEEARHSFSIKHLSRRGTRTLAPSGMEPARLDSWLEKV